MEKNYSYALKFSILDLSPKVTFLFLNLSKKKVQLFLIPAWAKETHFVLVKARQVFFFKHVGSSNSWASKAEAFQPASVHRGSTFAVTARPTIKSRGERELGFHFLFTLSSVPVNALKNCMEFQTFKLGGRDWSFSSSLGAKETQGLVQLQGEVTGPLTASVPRPRSPALLTHPIQVQPHLPALYSFSSSSISYSQSPWRKRREMLE